MTAATRRYARTFSSGLLRRSCPAALAVLLTLAPAGARLAAGQALPGPGAAAISPRAAEQIKLLVAEKMSRTPVQQKIDSRLLRAGRIATGRPLPGLSSLQIAMPMAAGNRVVLDVRATVTPALLARLRGLGADVTSTSAKYDHVGLTAPFDVIEAIAGMPEVVRVAPEMGFMTSRSVSAEFRVITSPLSVRSRVERKRTARADVIAALTNALQPNARGQQRGITNLGSVTSQGDVTHRAAEARATFGVNGTGVKIGVLSDGVNSLAASQASGSLGAVTVLPGQAGIGDEGTAMLEIVADLAPGAELYFATAFAGIASFATNIQALRDAGCDIIVDDVFYFVETPFQDGQTGTTQTNGGIVIQAVKNVAASGALFFSSAGNSGRANAGTSGTWEGDFVDGGTATGVLADAGQLHNFGGALFNTMTSSGGSPNTLYWSDPLGASGNDYDLYLLNSTGTAILDAGDNFQDGNDDPIELVGAGSAGSRLVIAKFGGANRFLHLSTNRGTLSIATGGQTHGHAATSAANTFGVAATPVCEGLGSTGPTGPCTTPFTSAHKVENFSSDGLRRVFYQGDGTAFTPGNVSSSGGMVLNKPDITAADGGDTSVPGFHDFFGTSAAAPHAAAIAALVKSRNLSQTAAHVSNALTSTAIDIHAAGFDRDSGYGIVMAFPAVATVTPVSPTPPAITLNPAGTTVLTGNVIVFATSATGNPTPTSQWQVSVNGGSSWVNIAGATGPTLSFAAQRSDNGKQYRNVYTNSIGTAATTAAALFVQLRVRTDLDNDRKTDLMVWRPDGGNWFWLKSTAEFSTSNAGGKQWGNAGLGDVPLSADMDGDGIMDLVVWRASTGTWYWLTSASGYDYGSLVSKQWGNLSEGDMPLAGDIDGDGKGDLIVWRASTGTWFWLLSSTGYNPSLAVSKQWGNEGLGDRPLLGDFDGDGLVDLTVWRASSGTWHWLPSGSGYDYAANRQRQWGNAGLGDIPLVADLDGDGVSDLVVWRGSDGTFYWLTAVSGYSYASGGSRQWGSQSEEDIPMLGDLDGDGIADLVVWRPAGGIWLWLTSSSGFAYTSAAAKQWGAAGDIPMIK